jgi:hypothetical protein|tara:strand:- start:230 stop:538 length:309 start_codon:yes stop_codon:yes gene_type:complete
MVKMESLDKLVGGLRAKFLRDEIELLKKRACGQASGHIHTAIVVLKEQLYVLEGTGLDDDGAAQLNYHLDHALAEKLDISLEELDALPLSEVEKLRLEEITT